MARFERVAAPSRFRWLLLALASSLLPSALPAQQYGFIARLGRDTLVVEQVTRSPGRLQGRTVARTPRVVFREYSAELAPDGTVRRMMVAVRFLNPPPNVPREQHISVEFGRDTLPVTVRSGDSTSTLLIPGAGLTVPWIVYGFGTWEQMIRAAKQRGGDSVAVTGYGPGGRNTTSTFVRRHTGDSVAIGFFGDVFLARVDREGRLLGLNGERTTIKLLVERVDQVDVEGIAGRFVAAENASGPVAALSLRDTAQAQVGGSDVLVDYGRPSRRGRPIFGNVVPFDQVWRTGANAATQFSTTRNLEFEGGLVVPAGKYTLWTLPTTRGVSLILNRQTGQWGTVYDQAQDLGRTPVIVERIDQPVDTFTVRIQQEGSGGRLIMEWDTVRWVAPFRVRP
jgi:hypothetical protein